MCNVVGAHLNKVDFRNANLQNVDVSDLTFEKVLFKANLEAIRGLDDAFIESINIGSLEEPFFLEEAKQ